MAVNFVFQENWIASKLAGMKTTCAIFEPTWTHILAPKGPNIELLKKYFSQERQIILWSILWLSDWLTKVKFLKIISFLPFLTQIRQKFGPKCPSNVALLITFALNFHSGVCTTSTFCFKDDACFFTFFTTLDLIWPKFCHKTYTHFDFFCCWFSMKYVRGFN